MESPCTVDQYKYVTVPQENGTFGDLGMGSRRIRRANQRPIWRSE